MANFDIEKQKRAAVNNDRKRGLFSRKQSDNATIDLSSTRTSQAVEDQVFQFDGDERSSKENVGITRSRIGRSRKDSSDSLEMQGADYRLVSSEDSSDELIEGSPHYGYDKRRRHKKDDVNPYADELDERFGMDKRQKRIIALGVALILVTIAAILLPGGILSENIRLTAASFLRIFQQNVNSVVGYITGTNPHDAVSMSIYRYIIIAFAGAALGVTGAVYQGSFKNGLAAPGTLGITAGGTLGAMVFIIFLANEDVTTIIQASEAIDIYAQMDFVTYTWSRLGQAFCTLIGCFVTVAAVVAISLVAGRGKVSNTALIVSGQVFSAIFSGIFSLVRYYYSIVEPYGIKSEALQNIRSGSFVYAYQWVDALLVCVPILIGIIIVMRLRMRLTLLAFSEEEARSMGLSVVGTRNLMVGVCTSITAVVIAFCGGVAFVGFIVPHLTRRIVGADFKYLVPASAFTGGLFTVIAYFITALGDEVTGSFNLFMSIIGAVVFLFVLISQRGYSHAQQ